MNRNVQRAGLMVGIVILAFLIFRVNARKPDSPAYQRNTQQSNVEQSNTENEILTETEQISVRETLENNLKIVTPGGNPILKIHICSDHYESEYHQRITLRCSSDYCVAYGDVLEEHSASEPVWFTLEDPWLSYGAVTLTPKDKTGIFTIPELKRNQEVPTYAGSFIVEKKEAGLQVINQVPLETYLCGVVPSEMPSDYPMEALKAQAVCARTYALKHLQENQNNERDADMDDSVSFQVYNNVAGNERTAQAVRETKGQVLMNGTETLVDALYYSTSCGLDLKEDLSGEAVFCAAFDGANEKAWEKEEPWYRWTNEYSLEELTRLLKEAGQENLGEVTKMEITSRAQNGRAEQLKLTATEGEYVLDGEYQIRKFLKTAHAEVTLQNQKKAPDLGMLPSAYFYLIPEQEEDVLKGYEVIGGGYGHGIGLSQNGAKHMAEAGKNYREILQHYYDTRVKSSNR